MPVPRTFVLTRRRPGTGAGKIGGNIGGGVGGGGSGSSSIVGRLGARRQVGVGLGILVGRAVLDALGRALLVVSKVAHAVDAGGRGGAAQVHGRGRRGGLEGRQRCSGSGTCGPKP